MAHYIIKAAPDTDLYGLFSTVVDGFIFIGSRDDVVTYLSTPTEHHGTPPLAGPCSVAERLARADQVGTCVLPDGTGKGGFGDTDLMIARDGLHTLPRDRLKDYLTALRDGNDEAAKAMLTPIVWNDEPGGA